MIITEENTTPQIKMYLRDFATESFEMEIISEDQRTEKVDQAISGTYDDFRKVLTFSYDISALSSEAFYVIKIWEANKVKLLSQDRMYIIPSGSDVATYQPKLAVTEKTMNNEFKIYGE
jgi:predicted lipase